MSNIACRNRDLTGHVFGDLTVVEVARRQKTSTGTRVYWRCKCSCGAETVARADALKSGDYRSCGCRKLKQLTKHGFSGTPEHKTWRALFDRCRNPNVRGYKNYGGRGIDICDEWASDFLAFYRSVGPKPNPTHSLDRIDNNRGYEPGNCRWATKAEQAQNRRTTIRVCLQDGTVSASVAARRANLAPTTVIQRLKRGWTQERALSTPVLRGGQSC